MTALDEYERLEATALWRAHPDDQRREVLVTLGDATLTIAEFSGLVVAHWSIAALRRGPDRDGAAVYHPDGDPGETLELAPGEAAMIDALDRLLRAIDRRRPHPGKLRLILVSAGAAAIPGAWRVLGARRAGTLRRQRRARGARAAIGRGNAWTR
jgi:hypothetical protein